MEFATRAEYVLFYMGAIASGLFIAKIILMWLGGDFEGEADFEPDAGDSDGDFGVFSINAMICFFMALGWFGFAALTEWGFTFYPAIGIGVVAGVSCSLLFSISLGFAKKLNHVAATPTLKKGEVGQVYTKIPAHGIGKVTVDNKIMKATSDKELESFQRVKVLEDIVINTNSVVKVTPV